MPTSNHRYKPLPWHLSIRSTPCLSKPSCRRFSNRSATRISHRKTRDYNGTEYGAATLGDRHAVRLDRRRLVIRARRLDHGLSADGRVRPDLTAARHSLRQTRDRHDRHETPQIRTSSRSACHHNGRYQRVRAWRLSQARQALRARSGAAAPDLMSRSTGGEDTERGPRRTTRRHLRCQRVAPCKYRSAIARTTGAML